MFFVNLFHFAQIEDAVLIATKASVIVLMLFAYVGLVMMIMWAATYRQPAPSAKANGWPASEDSWKGWHRR